MKIIFNPVTRRFSYDDGDIVYRLVDTLNDSWDYGVLKGNRKITNLSNFDFEKDYRTIPINKLKEYKIGLCWDFVNWEHYVLDKHKIKHKCYFIFIDLNNDHYITHTFVIVELNGKKLWIESALYKYRGVHEVTGLNDVITTAFSDHNHYDTYEYNPNGLDKNLTDKEFVDKATKKLVYTTDNKSFSDNVSIKEVSYDDLMAHKKDPKWKELGLIHTINGKDIGFDFSYIVAFDKNDPVGLIALDNDNNYLMQLVVKPNQRGKGIGSKLIQECITRGCDTLAVRKSNDNAINLYKKFGFEFTGKELGGNVEMKLTKNKSFSTSTELTDIIKFNDYLNKFHYGCPFSPHGAPYYGLNSLGFNDSPVDEYELYYRTLTPSEFFKYKMGFCTDFTIAEADYFKKHFKDVKFETYNVEAVNDKYGASHDFLVFYLDDKVYWFESSLDNLGLSGVHEYKDLRTLMKDFCRIAKKGGKGNIHVIRKTNTENMTNLKSKDLESYIKNLPIIGKYRVIGESSFIGYMNENI